MLHKNPSAQVKLSFSFKHNDFEYQVIAEPVIYEHAEGSFASGNYLLEIHTPDGCIKTDFYPESNEMFGKEIDEAVGDIISTQLLKDVPHASNN